MTINYATGAPVVVKSVKTYTSPTGTVCDQVDIYPDGLSNDRSHFTFLVPHTVDQGVLTPVVMSLHGSGDTFLDIVSGHVHAGGLTDTWVDRGWLVVGMAGSSNGVPRWGFEPARLGAIRAWRYVQSLFTVDSVLIYGLSMGAEYGINAMVEALRTSPAMPVKAWCGNSPAVNLRWICTSTESYALRPGISYAYFGIGHAMTQDGGTVTPGDDAWAAAVDVPDGGHDPCQIDLATVPHVPMRMYVGTNDTLIDPAQNGRILDARLTAVAWEFEHDVIVYTGSHGGPDSYRPADVLAFFDRALAL